MPRWEQRPPLDDEQRALIEDFLPTALAMAKAASYHHPGWHLDLAGAAQLGLCMAARSYNGTIPFALWAAFRVRHYMRNEMAWLRRGPAGYQDADCDPGLIPGREAAEPDDWPAWLERAWEQTPEDRRDLILRRFRGHTWEAIGEARGTTGSAAYTLFRRELARLGRGARHARPGRPRLAV